MSENNGEFANQEGLIPLVPSIEAAGLEISDYLSDNGITRETGFSDDQEAYIKEWLRVYIEGCPYLGADFLVESNRLLFVPEADYCGFSMAVGSGAGQIKGELKGFSVTEFKDYEGREGFGLMAIVRGIINIQELPTDCMIFAPIDGNSVITPFFPEQVN